MADGKQKSKLIKGKEPVWRNIKPLRNCRFGKSRRDSTTSCSISWRNQIFHSPLGFRNQLDRASLSISNNIAEGFERSTTNELLSFIAIARGSSGEVRSMMAVVKDRPKLKRYVAMLQKIRGLAESCARQLTGWQGSIDQLPFEGRRHLSARDRESQRVAKAAKDFRLNFLKNLKSNHPLYNSSEAKAARGEPAS
jgi:four helix bundle protein